MKKGCIEKLTEEQAKGCIEVDGAIVLDNWRPFTYMIMLLDFKDIIENKLANEGCTFIVKAKQFTLTEDERFTIKIVKIPKFDYDNLVNLVFTLHNSVTDIKHRYGGCYKEQFDRINHGFELVTSGEL